MKTSRKKLARVIAVLAASAAATGIGFGLAPSDGESTTVSDGTIETNMPLSWEALARRGGAARGAPSEGADDGEHDLSALRLVSRVMLLVQENYVDPDKVEPREMLLGALDYIEKRIPEVLVDDRKADAKGEVSLTVNRETTTIELGGLSSVWDLTPRLKAAFSFIQDNLVTTEDTRRIEYAAINGMLSTLDPHSILLDPEQYSDMKMQTRGEFGGLGFIISMRDGDLTVMRIIPNTPAHKGGLKPRDVITRIEDESTINMDLTDAVNRLRGKPGTKVSIWIDRKDFDEAKEYNIERAIIEIESIDPVRLLDDSVGYIRVTNFQGHTTRDLKKAISKLRDDAEEEELRGLILDLRGNPGGLLEQAIQVADLFIPRGTLVSTVGMNNRLRERKTANESGTITDTPLIVLVSSASASASEIVGGAVRNLDRGLVMGNPTFGKGSVQVLYDLVDDSALKLTIAEYLTPGDVSIQDKGIVPDADLLPALVSKNRVMVFAPRRTIRDSELAQLQAEGVEAPIAPELGLDPFQTRTTQDEDEHDSLWNVTFLRDDVPDDEEIDEFEEPEWEADFHVELARAILAEAGAPTRRAMLEGAEKVVEDRREQERRRIYDAISALNLDWSSPGEDADSSNPPEVKASIELDGPAKAGEETKVALTLTNESDEPLHRVRAWTESKSPRTVRYSFLFDRLEFLFGKLEPGESRTWKVPVDLPSDLTARREMLKVRVEAEGTGVLPAIPAVLDIDELPRPAFAIGWQVSTDGDSGDGRLPIGKESTLDVFVRNIGEGASSGAVTSIKNLEDEHVYITRGRQRIGELQPSGTERSSMTLELREGYERDAVRLRVTVLDRDKAQYISDEIEIPVAGEPAEIEAASGAVRALADVGILAWAGEGAVPVAHAKEGATIPIDGKVGDMYRVVWTDGRKGFLPSEAVRHLPRGRRAPAGEITALFPHSPPKISLEEDLRAAVTDSKEIVISGLVEADDDLRDVYIFINNDKVFFRAWENIATSTETEGEEPPTDNEDSAAKLPFETTLPLDEGANSIMIFARKSDELQARRHLVIFRTPSALAETQGEAEKSGEIAPPDDDG